MAVFKKVAAVLALFAVSVMMVPSVTHAHFTLGRELKLQKEGQMNAERYIDRGLFQNEQRRQGNVRKTSKVYLPKLSRFIVMFYKLGPKYFLSGQFLSVCENRLPCPG